MEAVTAALLLLGAVVLSGPVSRLKSAILPLPLVQITFGIAIECGLGRGVVLQPEVFFLLFLPPLLFLDGWRIPKESLARYKSVILGLALGLVVFTVLGIGLLVHWLIPAIPLAVAFALAAIVSPTDPVAVSAIAGKSRIPDRLMRIVEGEALLNDASGLVCMKFAVAAVLTGVFSLSDAVLEFIWVAAGGVGIGAALTWGVTWAKATVSMRVGEEAGSQILISLLMPFGAYLTAEHLGCSGILAAVAAGVAMSYAEQSGRVLALTRVRRSAVWDAVQFAANGAVFVLLGEQFPRIVAGAALVAGETGHGELALVGYVIVINVALLTLRMAWVWISLKIFVRRPAGLHRRRRHPTLRLVLVASLAGVRGAVTLAGVLALPLALHDGSPFPARDLAILLASGVIVVSLISASLALPALLTRLRMAPEPSTRREEDRARSDAAEAAISAIGQAQQKLGAGSTDVDLFAGAAARLMDGYKLRIERGMKTGSEAATLRKIDRIERELLVAGLKAERETYYKLARAGRIPHDLSRKLVGEVDYAEARQG